MPSAFFREYTDMESHSLCLCYFFGFLLWSQQLPLVRCENQRKLVMVNAVSEQVMFDVLRCCSTLGTENNSESFQFFIITHSLNLHCINREKRNLLILTSKFLSSDFRLSTPLLQQSSRINCKFKRCGTKKY